MRPMTIRYVQDVDAARHFYQALGLAVDFTSRPPRRGPSVWTEMRGGHGVLALHHVPAEAHDEHQTGGIGLAFEADEPLEDVVARLEEAGFEPATAIVDESFGRSFTVRDPGGLVIQVNEHDRDLQR